MNSLSKLFLFGSISALLLVGGLVSVSLVLAESGQDSGMQDLAGEAVIDPAVLKAGIASASSKTRPATRLCFPMRPALAK